MKNLWPTDRDRQVSVFTFIVFVVVGVFGLFFLAESNSHTPQSSTVREGDYMQVIGDNGKEVKLTNVGSSVRLLWRVKNGGTTTWTKNYSIEPIKTDIQPSQLPLPPPTEKDPLYLYPGEIENFSMSFTIISDRRATYVGAFQLFVNGHPIQHGDILRVQITIDPAGTP